MSDQNTDPDVVVHKASKIDLPGNSKERVGKKASEKTVEPRVLQPVISGAARKKKKSVGSRMKENFFGDDAKGVGSSILHDILIPALRNLLYDTVVGGLETSLYGSKRGSRTSRIGGASVVSYNSISTRNRSINTGGPARDISRSARASHDFDDIDFDTRGDAELVLSELVDLTIDYGMASIADFYQLSGIVPDFTDDKWGWEDLTGARVVQTRGRRGYIIQFPRPIQLT